MAKHDGHSNPRVSVDEIRAKRLATEAAGASISSPSSTSPTMPSDAQQPGTTPESSPSVIDQQATNPSAPPPIAASNPNPPAAPVIPDLESMLAAMTPEQIGRLRVIAAAKGVAVPSPAGQSTTGTRHADGSMDVTVHLSSEIVEQLELWAEADSLSVVEEAQKRIEESLQNYLYGDWSTPTQEETSAVKA